MDQLKQKHLILSSSTFYKYPPSKLNSMIPKEQVLPNMDFVHAAAAISIKFVKATEKTKEIENFRAKQQPVHLRSDEFQSLKNTTENVLHEVN